MIRLPGVCIVCREPVVWTGKRWCRPTNPQRRHACPEERPTCGAWMPRVKERCARKPGHVAGAHRSAYALENERRMRKMAA